MPTPRAPSLVGVLVLALALGTAGCSLLPSPAATIRVSGRASAGPTCPVERPGDPNCAPRPVAGAVIVIATTGGQKVGEARTAADGTFAFDVAPGDYRLIPQAVEGLIGGATPVDFAVRPDGPAPTLDVQYDTGIR